MSDASLLSPEAPAEGAEHRGLFYPLGRWAPQPGGLHEVAEGLFWLRMPLPIALDHINLWVLDDGDGWAIVDTGLGIESCRAVWRAALAGPLAGRPVRRVIVTHYHPDHMGLAGWLCFKHDAPLSMTRGEYLLGRVLTLDAPAAPPEAVIRFYARAGWPDEAVARLRTQDWGRFRQVASPLPIGYDRLRDGQVLRIGGRGWQVVTGAGHSPEHACLVCDELGVMIAGDQLLPRITSNVSVYPTEPRADPLSDWLASLDKLEEVGDRRVLPAHGEPFDGLTLRTAQLRAHHARQLDAVEALCERPRTAFDCFDTLFGPSIGTDEFGLATGEALAHLHHLEATGRVRRIAGDGIDRFVRESA